MAASEQSRVPARRMPRRISGVDAARGLALIGMFVAHVAPPAASAEVAELIALADERPRLLFALTAGIGLGLLTGGTHAVSTGSGRAALRRQVAIRAVILIALGVLIVATLNPLVYVILDEYGIAFLLLLPLLFVSGRVAVALGASLLAVAPAVADAAARDPGIGQASGLDGGLVVDWFLTGAYPVIVWVPVMLIGLGLARSDVASPVVVRRYALAGALAASACLPAARLLPDPSVLAVGDPTAAWSGPLRASLEAVGNVGVGLLVVAACVTLTTLARPPVRRVASHVLAPVTAMGAMPLTIYTGHLVVISAAKRVEGGVVTDDSAALLLGLIAGSMLFAWLWERSVGRGPLEMALRWASGRARADAARRATPAPDDSVRQN